MPDPMTPDEVKRLTFKSVFRGFNPAQVSAQLNGIAEAMEALIAERDELRNTPAPDPLEEEVEAVRRDVGEILDSAREVANAMRTRATTDAAAIVRRAEEEAIQIRSVAAEEARNVPKHMADPDDIEVPTPRPVGEETPETGEPLLGKPLYPPGAPPGGWGAPTVRVIGRDHPSDEEESDDADDTTEERTDEPIESPDDEVEPTEQKDSEDEKTKEEPNVTEPELEPAGTVEEDTADEDTADADTAEEEAAEPEDSAEEEAADPVAEIPPAARREEIGSLFASLRGEDPAERPAPVETVTAPEPSGTTVYPLPDLTTDEDEGIDFEPIEGLLGEPFEIRERLLLPVTNRCLRGLKRQLADIQNDSVELAVETEWEPDAEELAEEVRPSLKILVSEGFAAGHTAVLEWTGVSVARPQITDRDPSTRFVSGLVDDIDSSLVGVKAERGRSSAVSRVLRAWRTDEAERRVRSLAHEAFHRGILASVVSIEGHQPRWLVAGSGCALCREKQDTIPVTSPLPPVHAACECVIGVVTV
ncbi:MAG: hypothetical protein GEU79_12145 [Acidimicrobiia bacterium]|nr:hypothetical protein [Acidimicrobiia bacterium]